MKDTEYRAVDPEVDVVAEALDRFFDSEPFHSVKDALQRASAAVLSATTFWSFVREFSPL